MKMALRAKVTWIVIGVQAGTPLFHAFDLEPGDTDPGDFDAPAPVTENVAPTPPVSFDEPARVLDTWHLHLLSPMQHQRR